MRMKVMKIVNNYAVTAVLAYIYAGNIERKLVKTLDTRIVGGIYAMSSSPLLSSHTPTTLRVLSTFS